MQDNILPFPAREPENSGQKAPAAPVPGAKARIWLPRSLYLVVGNRQSAWLWPDGEVETLTLDATARRLRGLYRPPAGGAPARGERNAPRLAPDRRPPVVCHAPAIARRLGIERFPACDLLELFAFVWPARFCLPSPIGLAEYCGLVPGDSRDLSRQTDLLHRSGRKLLEALDPSRAGTPDSALQYRDDQRRMTGLAWSMHRAGWSWGPSVLAALAVPEQAPPPGDGQIMEALAVWRRLPEWAEDAPPPPPGNIPVEPEAARARLRDLLGSKAETRQSQSDYSATITAAFQPREEPEAPNIVLAEAGTGVGKTMGYIAPASLWAERNAGSVWISTYTRNLQHQIDGELDRLFPDPEVKRRRVVLRKGRENYLCLLNLEEAALSTMGQLTGLAHPDAVAVGLMTRWTDATGDGALTGGDFPGWLADLAGRARSLDLADRRGECIFSACPHYHCCFVERSIRRARRADIVVANHALVMIQAALGGAADGDSPQERVLPARYIFDEGHHLFSAADSAFATALDGQETAELRRWMLGAESDRAGGARSRARGLRRRLDELVAGDSEAEEALDAALLAARCLPSEGWLQRLADGAMEALAGFNAPLDGRGDSAATPPSALSSSVTPFPDPASSHLDEEDFMALTGEEDFGLDVSPGPSASQSGTGLDSLSRPSFRDASLWAAERFLALVRRQVYARSPDADNPYSLETEVDPVAPELVQAARELDQALEAISRPLTLLAERLTEQLDKEAADLDSQTRQRLESGAISVKRRALMPLAAWRSMLQSLGEGTPAGFVDWFAVDRIEGRDINVGMHRHWIDPTRPFAETLARQAHGMVVTSATLTDAGPDHAADPDSASDNAKGWAAARIRSGAVHLSGPLTCARALSPFNYPEATQVLIVNDVRKDNMDAVSAACRELMLASGGGALGLFTAISRLKAVHKRILPALDEAGLPLYAQHVDGLDTATLVDMFRGEADACLLGTDAVRDGVDVPGDSLRLIIFDRVPWPRPDILHKARRAVHPRALGGAKGYDDMLTRLRLKQAFGRLIRRDGDRGLFVLLDPMMPTRLCTAFPEGVTVERVGLKTAIEAVKTRLA